MPGKHVFEYAVIRVVPRVEREEFMNVGVVLYCKKLNFLQAIITVNEAKICCFTNPDEAQQIKPTCMHSSRSVRAAQKAAP
jgi:hypothetical protein